MLSFVAFSFILFQSSITSEANYSDLGQTSQVKGTNPPQDRLYFRSLKSEGPKTTLTSNHQAIHLENLPTYVGFTRKTHSTWESSLQLKNRLFFRVLLGS